MVNELIDELRILGSTNTQTRRLGYVIQICRILGDEYTPPSDLQKYIEKWSEENTSALKKHVSDKGEIRRSSRSLGSKRYITLARDLFLVTTVSGYLRLTKTGRVLLALGDELCAEDNPFRLGSKAALLLCYQLLLLDADYLLPTLELTTRYHRQTELLENAQKQLLHRFGALETHVRSPLLRSEVHERFMTMSRWTKPVKYLEHIVLPRLHWLLDLEVLDWNSFQALREFEPNVAGRYLLEHVPIVDGYHVANRSWCQNVLFSVWAEGIGLPVTVWHRLPQDRQESLIEEYVSIGFPLFRTMEYPRISAYQLVLFTILHLLFDKHVIAGFEDIKQALSKFSRSGHVQWNFFWSSLDDDGYLLLS